jgi:hypothetical protein
MNHVIDLLGPYHDGELRASQVNKVENHLETCELCRCELTELIRLRQLLLDTATQPVLKYEDQFVAEVGLLLQRQPASTLLQRTLVTGWKAIPVSLAASWIFVQTALIVTSVVYDLSLVAPRLTGIERLVSVSRQPAWANTLSSFLQPSTMQILEEVTKLLSLDFTFSWSMPFFIIFSFVIGTLFVCWLASWWVVKEHSTANKLT